MLRGGHLDDDGTFVGLKVEMCSILHVVHTIVK